MAMKWENLEITKLRAMLDKAGIPHEDRDYMNTGGIDYQTLYPEAGDKAIYSVIFNKYSYGYEDGALEIAYKPYMESGRNVSDGIQGWLSAEEVFKKIKKDWEKHNGRINTN